MVAPLSGSPQGSPFAPTPRGRPLSSPPLSPPRLRGSLRGGSQRPSGGLSGVSSGGQSHTHSPPSVGLAPTPTPLGRPHPTPLGHHLVRGRAWSSACERLFGACQSDPREAKAGLLFDGLVRGGGSKFQKFEVRRRLNRFIRFLEEHVLSVSGVDPALSSYLACPAIPARITSSAIDTTDRVFFCVRMAPLAVSFLLLWMQPSLN